MCILLLASTPPPELTPAADTTVEDSLMDTSEVPSPEPEKPKKTPVLKADPKPAPTITSTPIVAATKMQNESSIETPETAEPELVSRSGRKIKPKRFVDSETDDSPAPKRKMTIDSPKEEVVQASSPPQKEVDKIVLQHLKLESTLLELDHQIKSSTGLNGAKPEECIKHLDTYKQLEITPLMLKKHPNCVETMKRLRRYVGNVKAWEMNDLLKQEFDSKAHQIRTQAEDIYSSFKRMFNFDSESQPFWNYFQVQVDDFKKKTLHLTQEQVQELIEEPIKEMDAQ